MWKIYASVQRNHQVRGTVLIMTMAGAYPLFQSDKMVSLAGDHSTNIVLALQVVQQLKLYYQPTQTYIRQPGPRHAPLREAVVSFVPSRLALWPSYRGGI